MTRRQGGQEEGKGEKGAAAPHPSYVPLVTPKAWGTECTSQNPVAVSLETPTTPLLWPYLELLGPGCVGHKDTGMGAERQPTT